MLIFLIALQATIAAIVVGDSDALGLNRTLVSWLVILNIPISIFANQIKALGAAGVRRSPLQHPDGQAPGEEPAER